MRRRGQTYRRALPPVVLYKEDLEDLVGLIGYDEGPLSLCTSEYEYDDLKEFLVRETREIRQFEIQRKNPSVAVRFTESSCVVTASDDAPLEQGVVTGIQQRLLKCRIRLWWAPNEISFVIGTIALWTSAAFGYAAWENGRGQFAAGMGGLFILGCGSLCATYQYRFHRYARVRPWSRSSASSFWTRKRDDLLLIVIGAAAGSLITLLISNLTGAK